jgi:hypothetical protein
MKGAAMKMIIGARFILVLLLILSIDAVQYDAPAVSDVGANPEAYAKRYLTFKNWMRSSNDQRKKLISGYLRLLETDRLAQITMTNQSWAKEIIADISLEDLLSYVNETCTFSKTGPTVSEEGVETIIFKFVKNRLEVDKNYHDLLEVAEHLNYVKNLGTEKATSYSKYDLPEYLDRHNNVFETPYVWFWYGWWQKQNQNEKKALVSGYMFFLNEEIKRDWCYNEEERKRYDLFCKLVSVNDLVNYVDKLYKNPLYRKDHAGYMIYEYMIYNFQIYIGAPIALQG